MREAAVVMKVVVLVEVNDGRARSCDPADWTTQRLKECCAEWSQSACATPSS